MKVKGFLDTIKWYDKNSQFYAKSIQHYSSFEELNEFASLLPKKAKVLDAGCAAGRDAAELARRGIEPIGIDLSSNLIKIAKKRYPSIKFVQGNFLKLPFKNSYFQGVWAHASLLHLDSVKDVKKALSEFYRVLQKGGIIHVYVKAQTGRKKYAIVKDKLSKHDRFFQFFKRNELKKLIKNAGFKMIKIEQYNETEKNPKGRKEVEWIDCLARK